MLLFLFYLQIPIKAVPLHCVFHSIRFKVNKGWSKALLLFLCLYLNDTLERIPRNPFKSSTRVIYN